MSLVMMVSFTVAPIVARAETTYWVDMSFARSNIAGLKNYISINGITNSDGEKVIRYYYPEYDNNYLILYDPITDVLDFWGDFGDGNYIELYYTYPYVSPSVQILFSSTGARTSVTFDVTEYYWQDLVFNINENFGNLTYSEIQDLSNKWLRAGIEGWNNCLIYNTPYSLASIGFNDFCNHNLSTSYEAATFEKDGLIINYCYSCGYHEDTDFSGIGEVKLETAKYNYDGKVKSPNVIVTDMNGNAIDSSNYSVKYQNGRKNPGKYYVEVNFINGAYQGYKKLYFSIVPKNTAITSVVSKKKGFTLKWKKQATQTTGYQIRYSTSSKMSNSKTVTISKNTSLSKSITKLKSKKKYYIQIRTYKTVNGTKYYSNWSKSKTVTTK